MTKEILQQDATALKAAAQAVLDRWNSPKWDWAKQGPTADLMHALRVAIAQPATNPWDKYVAPQMAELASRVAAHNASQSVQPVSKQGEPIGYVAKDGYTILYFQAERLPFETELYIKQGGDT